MSRPAGASNLHRSGRTRYVVGAILIAILATAGLLLAITATGNILGPGAGRAARSGTGARTLQGGPYRTHAGGLVSHATPHFRSVEAALRASLDRQHLSYQWVVCTGMRRSFRGRTISRCNVDFGDPHVVPYCAVLDGGTLITDRENPALDCGSRVKADEQGVDRTVSPR